MKGISVQEAQTLLALSHESYRAVLSGQPGMSPAFWQARIVQLTGAIQVAIVSVSLEKGWWDAILMEDK